MAIGGNLTSIDVPRGLKAGRKPFFDKERAEALADVRYWPHPFRSTSEMCTVLGLPESKFKSWRLIPYELGYINGLPEISGRALATDGIMVLLKDEVRVHAGHLASFVHLNNLDETWEREKKPAVAKKPKRVYE